MGFWMQNLLGRLPQLVFDLFAILWALSKGKQFPRVTQRVVIGSAIGIAANIFGAVAFQFILRRSSYQWFSIVNAALVLPSIASVALMLSAVFLDRTPQQLMLYPPGPYPYQPAQFPPGQFPPGQLQQAQFPPAHFPRQDGTGAPVTPPTDPPANPQARV